MAQVVVVSEDAREQQRRLYGAPVREVVGRITSRLQLSQAAVARVLGLSPAMLSQLVTGQRIKIGNPLVLSRLQALHELASREPAPTGPELEALLRGVAESQTTITATATSESATGPARGAGAGPDPGAETVRRLLRAVASGRDLERAAAALDDVVPEVAAVLRIYGTQSADDAEHHFRSVAHLMS